MENNNIFFKNITNIPAAVNADVPNISPSNSEKNTPAEPSRSNRINRLSRTISSTSISSSTNVFNSSRTPIGTEKNGKINDDDFNISQETYQKHNDLKAEDDSNQIISVPRVKCKSPKLGEFIIFRPSTTERICTLATSNVVSSQVLTPKNDKPTIDDYTPLNLKFLHSHFDLKNVLEIKFMRTLNTALILIVAAYKTKGIPGQLKTKLQFGCGFGSFEGLHSSLIPEPSLTFEPENFKNYIQNLINDWMSQLISYLNGYKANRDEKNLSSLLFGADLKLLLIFFKNNPKTENLEQLVKNFIKDLEDRQYKYLKFYNDPHLNSKDLGRVLSKDDTKLLINNINKINKSFQEAFNEIIECPTNILENTHLHYSSNAIDVLPDALNQYDTMIENIMRVKLKDAIKTSCLGDVAVEKICEELVNELKANIERVDIELKEQTLLLSENKSLKDDLNAIEKKLQSLLEKLFNELKTDEINKDIEQIDRLNKLIKNNPDVIELYLEYILSLKKISDFVLNCRKHNLHGQTAQYLTSLEKSYHKSMELIKDFYKNVTAKKDIWFLFSRTSIKPEDFIKNAFAFLLQSDPSNEEQMTKDLLYLITEHFRRLKSQLKTNLFGIDAETIELKAQKLTEITKKSKSQNPSSNQEVLTLYTTLLQSSFLLLNQETCSTRLILPLYALCKKLTAQAISNSSGILSKFLHSTYIHYNGYKTKELSKRTYQNLSTGYLDTALDQKPKEIAIEKYLNLLNDYLSNNKEPLQNTPEYESLTTAKNFKERITLADDIVKFITSFQADSDNPLMIKNKLNLFLLNYTLENIASGKFFTEFLDFISLSETLPGIEGGSLQRMGVFIQFALFDTNNNSLLEIKSTEASCKDIEDEIKKTLSLKQENDTPQPLIENVLSKLEFVIQQGIPAYLNVIKSLKKDELKTLVISEIRTISKKDPLSCISMRALKLQPLNQLAPILLASILKTKYKPCISTLRQMPLANRIFTGIQEQNTLTITYLNKNKTYKIKNPGNFKSNYIKKIENVFFKIYEIIKDLEKEFCQNEDSNEIELEVEVHIDYFDKQ